MLSKINHLGLFVLGTALPVVSGGLYLLEVINGGTAGLFALNGVWSMWAGHDLKKSNRRKSKVKGEE